MQYKATLGTLFRSSHEEGTGRRPKRDVVSGTMRLAHSRSQAEHEPMASTAPPVFSDFEPGSRDTVLRNRLGVCSARAIAKLEAEALQAAAERLIHQTPRGQRFAAADLCRIHLFWLGDIYHGAGQYRDVDKSRAGFTVPAAREVPRLMQEFTRGSLTEYTPCRFTDAEDLAWALAVVYADFLRIHPFRDGNARCARLLAILMGAQAGLPPLDFGGLQGKGKPRYIAAIHAGIAQNYKPMVEVFRRVLGRTLKLAAGN